MPEDRNGSAGRQSGIEPLDAAYAFKYDFATKQQPEAPYAVHGEYERVITPIPHG